MSVFVEELKDKQRLHLFGFKSAQVFLELYKDIKNVLYLIKEIINPNISCYSLSIRRLTSIDACLLFKNVRVFLQENEEAVIEKRWNRWKSLKIVIARVLIVVIRVVAVDYVNVVSIIPALRS